MRHFDVHASNEKLTQVGTFDQPKKKRTSKDILKFGVNLIQAKLYISYNGKWYRINPIPSMYDIFTYIYHKNQPNV